MNLSVGIVGLPNVGKSTLFKALLKKQQALAANYPSATIEPNIGIVPVPDARLVTLANIVAGRDPSTPLHSAQDDKQLPPIKNALIEFVDIAGLVKGASEGAGLGNKFLSHIREVSVIAHVVRAFVDNDVVREGSVNPEEDYQTVQTELILADLQTVEKQRESKAVKTDLTKKSAIEKLFTALNHGQSAREVSLTEDERESVRDLFLLSNKPEIIVLNVSEDQYNPEGIAKATEEYKKLLSPVIASDSEAISNKQGIAENIVVICAKIESELAALSDGEQKEYLDGLGLSASGLERLIQKAYATLGLISFLTAGEKEVRAWTIRLGSTSLMASGEIHTDFMKKFIKAEVVGFDNFVECNGWKGAREKGKARLEGRDYIVQDGDVVEFKIGS